MILLTAGSLAWADTAVDSSNFPDERFREFVRNFDTNNDGLLQDSETNAVETITVRGMNIASLEGISVFKNLKTLRCSSNNLTALDLSSNTLLEALGCDNNRITSLNLNACPNLREVFCTNNGLRTLDVSGCSALEELYCYVNSLDALQVSRNTALVSLDCQENSITALDLTSNTALQFLDCSDNKLTSLNLAHNPALKWLYCRDLNLGSNGLDVSNLSELSRLWCWNDGLSALDVTGNENLESLLCSGNNLTTLDLAGNPLLAELSCGGNPFTENVNVNTLLPLALSGTNTALLSGLSDPDNLSSDDIKGFDVEGNALALVNYYMDNENVYAEFDGKPSLVRYQYDTGNNKVNLSASYIAEETRGLASCTNGIFQGKVDGNIFTWKGIPYAKQPVGSLRWKAPQAPDASNELHEAFSYAPTPIQHYSASNPVEIMPAQGEDCLALNIWNNKLTGTPKPVMVWVHGGAFNSGGTANPDYDGQRFIEAHDDVILVSVGYRVGLMGFIDFINSGIPGSQNFPDSQNLGLLDVMQALRWIQENISSFGGDPDNVTIFGQSSGAAVVALVMANPNSSGLFRRAITESGAVSMTSSVEDCAALTQALVQITSADTMDKLMSLSSQDLQAAAEKLQPLTNFPERDGRIVAANPYEAFAVNSANFDFLAGTNADELNYWSLVTGAEAFGEFVQSAFAQIVGGISQVNSDDAARAEQFVTLYKLTHEDAGDIEAAAEFFNELLFRVPMLTEANSHAGKNYVYYWEYPSGLPGLGACHSLEIPYVLNHATSLVPFQINQSLSEKVQAMWVNFAKTGNPTTSAISWPEYSTSTQATMIISETPSVRNANLADQYALLSPLLKYGLSGRELISGIAAMNQGDDPSTASPDVTPESGDVGRSNGGGGCSAGFMFPVMIAVIAFSAKRRG